MKDNVVYNQPDNKLYVKTDGDKIVIICNEESQQEKVMKRMVTDTCILDSYEEWDEGDDMKWILTFRLLDEYELKPDLPDTANVQAYTNLTPYHDFASYFTGLKDRENISMH